MDIWVLNSQYQRVGLIDGATSIIWTTRYYDVGDFEIYIAADNNIIDLIRNNNYLVREQDIFENDEYKNVMVIDKCNIEIRTDIEFGDYFTVKGKCLKSIVYRRIVINQTIMNGDITNCIKRLLTENIINPTNTKRKINNFTFDNAPFNIQLTMQATGDNLGELITEICTNYNIGWNVKIKNNKFVLYLYKGVDRSLDQNVNPHVIFSYEFDNLLSSEYTEAVNLYANVAIVAGEGEGSARKKIETGDNTVTGLNRFETYVDARDLSSNEGELTQAQYNKMLKEKGDEHLTELQKIVTFEGEVDAERNYVLNRDFYLGDKVQITNEYGISRSARIIEIIDAEDETGRSIIPTFSDI